MLLAGAVSGSAVRSKPVHNFTAAPMSDQEELLKILQAQGQQFLESFAAPSKNKNKRKREKDDSAPISKPLRKITELESTSEDEWLGIAQASQESDGSKVSGEDHDHEGA